MTIILSNSCYQIVCAVKPQNENLLFLKMLMGRVNVKWKRALFSEIFCFSFVKVINLGSFGKLGGGNMHKGTRKNTSSYICVIIFHVLTGFPHF